MYSGIVTANLTCKTYRVWQSLSFENDGEGCFQILSLFVFLSSYPITTTCLRCVVSVFCVVFSSSYFFLYIFILLYFLVSLSIMLIGAGRYNLQSIIRSCVFFAMEKKYIHIFRISFCVSPWNCFSSFTCIIMCV